MLVCNYFIFFSFLRFLFYGIRRGVNGAFWGSGCFGRGGFVLVGVVLFTSGRQNGDMWHLYDAVLQQIAVMKQ